MLLALLVPNPALAQAPTIASYFQLWASDRAQTNLRKQAACIVRKYPAEARRVVVDEMTMRDVVNGMPALLKPCGSGALFKDNLFSISQPVFGLVLAEAMLARLPAGVPLAGVGNAPPLAREQPPHVDEASLSRRQRDAFALDAALLRLDAGGECVVRRDPQSASILARSAPSSAAERASLQTLQVAWTSCDGSDVDAPVFIRRGLIAYNLYRLMDAARLTGGKETPGA